MKALPSTIVRVLGVLALIGGVTGLLFVGAAATSGGWDLFTAPGSLALVFLFSLVLLVACSGFTLAVRGTDALQRSLVPRWALVVSGAAMLFSVCALLILGNGDSRLGMALLGALGANWLWKGLRRGS